MTLLSQRDPRWKDIKLGMGKTINFNMVLSMCFRIWEKHKIFNPIVVFNSVNVVYMFFLIKLSTQIFFHYYSMFKKLLITNIKKHVSSLVGSFSTLPIGMVFPSGMFNLGLSFFRSQDRFAMTRTRTIFKAFSSFARYPNQGVTEYTLNKSTISTIFGFISSFKFNIANDTTNRMIGSIHNYTNYSTKKDWGQHA